MSPVGKPTSDGEIILGSRHSSGTHGTLGAIVAWNCPACEKQNEGRRPEHGCIYCGAGDPTQSKAGLADQIIEAAKGAAQRAKEAGGNRVEAYRPVPPSAPTTEQAIRIYRLIEYVIRRPQDVQIVLRNSLVGRLEMGWGALTGTIVDSLDSQQEDRLRMARMQPGVWLANPEAMAAQDHQAAHIVQPLIAHRQAMGIEPRQVIFNPTEYPMEPPDTGPAFTEAEAAFGKMIAETYGYRLCYTLALALSTIAPELGGNMEPEKFLTLEECLALANALMQEIPADWTPQADAALDAAIPPPTPQDEELRNAARARVARVREGSKPTAIPWKDPTGGAE